jgi:signal transduction histidine kinase
MSIPNLKQTYQALGRGAHFLFVKYLQPKSKIEDERRREFILNVILLGTIFLLTLMEISLLSNILVKGGDYHGLPALVFTLILVGFLILYVLSRVGYFKISSYIFVFFFSIATLYGALRWGVDLPSVLLSYAIIIVITSILISTRTGLLVALLISALIILFTVFTTSGELVPDTSWKANLVEMNDAVVFSAMLLLIWGVSWLSNSEIEKSLYRARKSEKALKDERDFLEIKVEERTRELKQAQLQKMNQLYRFAEFGKLSSGLFHDLVNPLTALALNLEKLKDIPSDPAQSAQPYVQKAIAASRRMESFIAGLKKQIQKQDINEEFLLNQEVEQAMELLGYKARKAKVNLRFVAAVPVTTYGNPLKFYQIVVNLVSNAIDAYHGMPEEQMKSVLVSLHKNGRTITLVVKDWAVGIPDDVVDKIFEPFYTTKNIEMGSGIGLSTVKDIVAQEFDGEITVSSKLGHGALFTVSFEQRDKRESQKNEDLLG